MALSFGTSGVRGLATDLTDEACARFARSFITYFKTQRPNDELSCVLAGDLRESTPRMMSAIARALQSEGCRVLDAGITPTPALAFACIELNLPGIMVTGSHIPADRNGIKFYFPWGEILKEDERPILDGVARLEREGMGVGAGTHTAEKLDASARFTARFLDFFGPSALKGMKLAFYEHSTAARDLLPRVLEGLGATVTRFGRSEAFIPVDTEALENVRVLSEKVRALGADALISADGDGDRPLFLDEKGEVIRGDQLGIVASIALAADSVSTPVSTTTSLDRTGKFAEVRRTRIGSPFVVAEMGEALKAGRKRVVGFEANGGFLLGSPIPSRVPGGRALTPLPTRDCVLPVLLALAEANERKISLSARVRELPERFTDSALIRPFEMEKSQKILALLRDGKKLGADWGAKLGAVAKVDLTDGVRAEFANTDILHFRPSGNAPEFRIYTESAQAERARELCGEARQWVEGLAKGLA